MILKQNKEIKQIWHNGKRIETIMKNHKLIFGKKIRHLTPYYMIIDQSEGKFEITNSEYCDDFFKWFMDGIKMCWCKKFPDGIMRACRMKQMMRPGVEYDVMCEGDKSIAFNGYYMRGTEQNKKDLGPNYIHRGDYMINYPEVFYLGVNAGNDKWIVYFDKKPFPGCVSNLGPEVLLAQTCCRDINNMAYASPDGVSTYNYASASSKIEARGEGYSMLSWDQRCLLTFLYMMNNKTNDVSSGPWGSNIFGMDSFVADRSELQGNCYNENKILTVTHDDGVVETFDCTFFPTTIVKQPIRKLFIGKYLMIIPSEIGNPGTTGGGVFLYNNGPNYASYPESGDFNILSGTFDKGGIGATCTTRLAYMGPIIWMETDEEVIEFDDFEVIN